MEIVIDTSVLIAVIADEPEKERLVLLTRGSDLVAPQSVHWEIANAFSAMLKRSRITLPQALKAIQVYQQIPLRLVDVELEDSLKIAQQFEMYAYDAFLLRCALKYKLPLITLDQTLVMSARKAGISLIEVNP